MDSSADAEIYRAQFEQICDAIANVLGGVEETDEIEPPPTPVPEAGRVDIEVSGNAT